MSEGPILLCLFILFKVLFYAPNSLCCEMSTAPTHTNSLDTTVRASVNATVRYPIIFFKLAYI